MIQVIGNALLGIGAFCALVGAIGVVRLPDVYNRIHANTVCVVGGAMTLMLGVGLLEGLSFYTLKALTIALFIFLTNPVGAHAIARAAHRSGVKLWRGSVVDKLAEERSWDGSS
ncbi:MAG: monovalent cation/H(+) antiporter subunit G [Hadesarchaea archaeon]|nr:monovalent cation/H(+) antiporter subunit G [Hadesarchaea archaeon]